MRKRLLIICNVILCSLFLLTSCKDEGRNNISLYTKKYNDCFKSETKKEKKEQKEHPKEIIDEKEYVLHKEKQNIYYYFFPEIEENNLMLVLFEDNNKEINEFGICVIDTKKVGVKNTTEYIKNIFTANMSALTGTDNKKASSIFSELGLNKEDTYMSTKNELHEYDSFNISIIVNDAGTGVYVATNSS